MISREMLMECLEYKPDDGTFIRKKSPRGDTLGKPAGCIQNSSGYVLIHIRGKSYRAHRLAFLYMRGVIPLIVDHINGNRSDNRWSNLRESTKEGNSHNSIIGKNNKSGVKCVSWNKRLKKWHARIMSERKYKHIGYFPDLIGAELAVRKSRIELHGEFANHG